MGIFASKRATSARAAQNTLNIIKNVSNSKIEIKEITEMHFELHAKMDEMIEKHYIMALVLCAMVMIIIMVIICKVCGRYISCQMKRRNGSIPTKAVVPSGFNF